MNAPIAAIPSLFNTGTAPDYSLLANGAADTHWGQVAVSPDPAWLPDGGTSRWISPAADRNEPVADFVYALTFTLSQSAAQAGLSGRLSCDDRLTAWSLNGQPIAPPATLQSAWTAFSLTPANGLVAGQNTLLVTVHNAVAASPTGFRLEWLGTVTIPVPTLIATPCLIGNVPTIELTGW